MPSQPLYPNESELEVLHQSFCFGSSSVHHATLFNKGSFLFVFELFQKYSTSKYYFGPWGWTLFFIAAPASIVIIMGIALINAKPKSVIVFAIILFPWDIKGDSWLMTWLALSCNSQNYDDFQSALSTTPWYRPWWKPSVEGVICKSKLQQIAHTVKFNTKLANIVTLKGSLIAQSHKLVTACTRPQVRIVSCNFSDNYNIKRNTTMNVNRSQKHGHILHCITHAKSRTTKITVMHRTLTHFNSKSVKNPYFCIYFQCEKLTGNKIFLSQCISNYLFTLIYHLGLIQDIQYLVSIISNNVTNFDVDTAFSFSVILTFL